MIAWRENRLSQAESHFLESLIVLQKAEMHDHLVAQNLLGLARLTDLGEQPGRVATLIGAAEAFRQRAGFEPYDVQAAIQYLAGQAVLHLQEAAFDAAYGRGLRMTRREAIAFALKDAPAFALAQEAAP
jgi:hypothetical protein